MAMLLVLIFLILQAPSVLGATNNADSSLIPEECTNGNYRELIGPNHEHRYFNYSSTTLMKVNENTRDYSVGYDNWFRFRLAGKATRMLERNELEQDVSGVVGTKFKPCGTRGYMKTYFFDNNRDKRLLRTSNIFTLNDHHPQRKYELRLTTSLGCHYVQRKCVEEFDMVTFESFPRCEFMLRCEEQTTLTDIAVRNCGDFFVYKTMKIPVESFDKDGIYCGTANNVTKVEYPQCLDHTTIVDDSRSLEAVSPISDVLVNSTMNNTIPCPNDEKFPANRWVRFLSNSTNVTMQLADDCSSSVVKGVDDSMLAHTTFCGALYIGWVRGGHPAENEGFVTRTLCFSRPSSCKCEYSSQISITNCGGGFYIYRRRTRDFPQCFARACTVKDKRFLPNPSSPDSSMMATMSIASTPALQPSASASSMMTNVNHSMYTSSMVMMTNKSLSSISTSSPVIIEMSSSSSMQNSSTSTSVELRISSSSSSSSPSSMIMSSSPLMISSLRTPMMMTTSNLGEYSPSMTSSVQNVSPSPTTMTSSSIMMSNLYVNSSMSVSRAASTTSQSQSLLSSFIRSSMSLSLTSIMESSINTTATTTTTTTPAPPPHFDISLCKAYETIIDNTRLKSDISLCDLKYHAAVRFKSSSGQNLQLRENCTATDQLQERKCTSFASNIWLPKRHPVQSNAYEVMEICYSTSSLPFNPGFCQCQQKEFILVQKCMDEGATEPFYVYRLFPALDKMSPDSLNKCKLRYCAEVQPGSKPTTTPSPKEEKLKKESFGIAGSFTINKPFVNEASLKEEHLENKNSDVYKFIVQVVKSKIQSSLKALAENITRIEVVNLSIGSLKVDYEVYGTSGLDNSTVEQELKKSFSDEQNIQLATGSNSFSGSIDPKSQQINRLDLCQSMPCHVNATCKMDFRMNTFSCKCNQDFKGDGISCSLIVEKVIVRSEKELDWSVEAIVTVAVLFSLCFIVIVVLACCLCYKRNASYHVGFQRGQNYSNYADTDVPLKTQDEYIVIKNDNPDKNESSKQI